MELKGASKLNVNIRQQWLTLYASDFRFPVAIFSLSFRLPFCVCAHRHNNINISWCFILWVTFIFVFLESDRTVFLYGTAENQILFPQSNSALSLRDSFSYMPHINTILSNPWLCILIICAMKVYMSFDAFSINTKNNFDVNYANYNWFIVNHFSSSYLLFSKTKDSNWRRRKNSLIKL